MKQVSSVLILLIFLILSGCSKKTETVKARRRRLSRSW